MFGLTIAVGLWSCRGVAMLRKWLDGPGGGGPTYHGPGRPGAGQMRDALGHLDRRLMLDRRGHTQNCAACRQVSTVTAAVR